MVLVGRMGMNVGRVPQMAQIHGRPPPYFVLDSNAPHRKELFESKRRAGSFVVQKPFCRFACKSLVCRADSASAGLAQKRTVFDACQGKASISNWHSKQANGALAFSLDLHGTYFGCIFPAILDGGASGLRAIADLYAFA